MAFFVSKYDFGSKVVGNSLSSIAQRQDNFKSTQFHDKVSRIFFFQLRTKITFFRAAYAFDLISEPHWKVFLYFPSSREYYSLSRYGNKPLRECIFTKFL